MCVKNSIHISEVFQIEVLDSLVRSLGSCQNSLVCSQAFTGLDFSGVCIGLDFKMSTPMSE